MSNTQELINEIRQLAKKKNALILAHNYQPPEIQDAADLTGDSLELSMQASQTNADIIVFCGVMFMAETASVLCRDKKVLIPVLDASCDMADMITPQKLQEFKSQYPNVPVVTYVNSTADVKALSDICCTSANAVSVVKHVGAPEVIMTPDKNLALWAKRHTEQKIHIYPGYCPVHNFVSRESVLEAIRMHPEAVVVAHPECPPEILDLAHYVRSTSGMLKLAGELDRREFIIITESGLLYPLKKQNPDKVFYHIEPEMICKHMKKITLLDLYECLDKERYEVNVPEEVRVNAIKAVKRMLEVPRDQA